MVASASSLRSAVIGPARRRILIVAGVLAMGVAGLGSLWTWVLSPETTLADDVEPADAVVLFVGGRGERTFTALSLMDAGVADTLVIPNGRQAGARELRRLCRRPQDFDVLCPDTDSVDTGGEARAIAAVAEERGWERLVMVTSDYHIARARLRLERCYPGEIQAVAAENWATRSQRLNSHVREWFGHLEARTIERGC